MSTDPRSQLHSNGLNFTSTTHADVYPFISPTKVNLTSLNVLITGASRGIGRATALAYAAAGASGIVIAARSDLSTLESELYSAASSAGRPKPTILSLKLDVRSKDSVSAAAKTVAEKFGHLDIVINNAGSSEKWVPMLESDPEDWWSGWETNLFGSYLICRYFLPLVLKSPEHGPRTTIAVSSVGAHGKRPTASGYQTNKLALLRLMEFVDAEYGGKEKGGILAYSIHPGGVLTELSKDLPIAKMNLLNDTPELAGETMVWLSAEKREWLAGRYVSVNWDMNEFLSKKDEIVEKDLLKVRMAVS